VVAEGKTVDVSGILMARNISLIAKDTTATS
jgi:hypothetical protein